MKWGPVRVLEQTSMKNLCALEGVEKSVGLGAPKTMAQVFNENYLLCKEYLAELLHGNLEASLVRLYSNLYQYKTYFCSALYSSY